MATDTTVPSYWLNWRVLLCAIWIASSMIFAAIIIWMYEGRNASRTRADGAAGALNKGDSWCTCFKSIHPIWLLVFRIAAFCVMLSLILADTILHSVGIFYHYTKWTVTMVTIYFGIGSSLSILGCLQCCFKTDAVRDHIGDSERVSFVAPPLGEDADTHSTNNILNGYNPPVHTTASIWEHAFQIIFQICAGAVVLTDFVYWLVLYPLYTGSGYKLTFKFPFFRIAYFALYTCAFVIFQWIIHVFVSMSWPYTFLDLSSPNAPLWYLCVGLLHLPCFGIFYLLFKMKQHYLSKL